MKTVFLTYKTDAWHSYASRDLIAVCSNFETAVKLSKKHAKTSGHKISQQEEWNLRNIKQTQGYSGDGEFMIEEMETNVLF